MSNQITVGKDRIISEICSDTSYSRATVKNVIDSLFTNIMFQLSNGNRVQFSGFGTFEMKERAARIGRNPHTKEAVPIPPRTIPFFSAGEGLKNITIRNKK